MVLQRIQCLAEADKVAWDQLGALMDQLIERMLAVSAWLTPINWPGLIIDSSAIERDVFAVAFHGQLLEVGRKALQVLLIGQHRDGLRSEEIVVPDSKQAHQDR